MYLSESLNVPLKDIDVFIGEEGIVTYDIRSTAYVTSHKTTSASFQNILKNMSGFEISVSAIQIENNIIAKTVGND
jgi:hypothetical protein